MACRGSAPPSRRERDRIDKGDRSRIQGDTGLQIDARGRRPSLPCGHSWSRPGGPRHRARCRLRLTLAGPQSCGVLASRQQPGGISAATLGPRADSSSFGTAESQCRDSGGGIDRGNDPAVGPPGGRRSNTRSRRSAGVFEAQVKPGHRSRPAGRTSSDRLEDRRLISYFRHTGHIHAVSVYRGSITLHRLVEATARRR